MYIFFIGPTGQAMEMRPIPQWSVGQGKNNSQFHNSDTGILYILHILFILQDPWCPGYHPPACYVR